MALTTAGLLDHLPSTYNVESGSNNEAIAKVFVDTYWSELAAAFVELRKQGVLFTATAGHLDQFGSFSFISVTRGSGESDTKYRGRIANQLQLLLGGTSPDRILEFVQAFLGAGEGDVTLTENDDGSGGFAPATFSISFSPQLLSDLGIPEPEHLDTIEKLEEFLNEVAPAGVRGTVDVDFTAAVWDTDTWDSGANWGS
jgi:hypothetical protein